MLNRRNWRKLIIFLSILNPQQKTKAHKKLDCERKILTKNFSFQESILDPKELFR